MKWPIAAFVLCCGATVALSFVHPYGNVRVEPHRGRGTLLRGAAMSAQAREVLLTKCADCHSSETHWPVYARVAPGSWLIERDIVKAREKMNLSKWEEMPADVQDNWAAEIVSEAKHGKMPPPQYLLLHWKAKLTPMDVAALSTLSKASETGTSAGGVGDAVHGKEVFQKHCTGCHALDVDREGPRLAGVFGRKAGSLKGFGYSDALKKSGVTWDEATLEKWLTDPDTMVPQNNMSISVPKAGDRRDLIAYLKQAK